MVVLMLVSRRRFRCPAGVYRAALSSLSMSERHDASRSTAKRVCRF
jgi:hypothetical protein